MLETIDVVRAIVGSGGNLPLAAERLGKKLNRKVNEYELTETVVSDVAAMEQISKQLRALLTIKSFDMLVQTHASLSFSLHELQAKDISRMYTSLMAVFDSLTNNVTKSAFDVNAEAQKVADELDLPMDEVMAELKQIIATKK